MRMNRELLRAMLGRHGHEVTFAQDGAEAVEWADRERFDLVLMDVRMPVMDGVEAARRIRRLPSPAGSVPILGLTANVMEAERRRCVEAGMDMILTKPVAWPQLFALLAEIAAGRSPSRG
jgi:CheY-like chemotaxis protein